MAGIGPFDTKQVTRFRSFFFAETFGSFIP